MEQTGTQQFKTFAEFWPFYLKEHSLKLNRDLHFLGTSIAFAMLIRAIRTVDYKWFLGAIVVGYAFAWIGHFVFEKNKPATFKYPAWSFMGDWKMWFMTLTGKLDEELKKISVNIS